MPCVKSLDHLVLTVRSIAQTVSFYQSVLGMTAQVFHPADGSARTALSFGDQKINLHQLGREFEPKAQHPVPGSADLCFLTDAPLQEWVMHLHQHDVEVVQGPIPRTGATGPIMSIYIRDPDQNLIEIAQLLS